MFEQHAPYTSYRALHHSTKNHDVTGNWDTRQKIYVRFPKALANAAMGTRLDQLIAKLLSTCAGQLTLDRQSTLYR